MQISFQQAVAIATRMQTISKTAANKCFQTKDKGERNWAISIATERSTDVGRLCFSLPNNIDVSH